MRTNIDIDDDLMRSAMEAGGFKTKREAVEEGLRLLARRKAYQNIRALRGKLHWSLDGDWTQPEPGAAATLVQEPQPAYARSATAAGGARKPGAKAKGRK